MDNLDSNDKKIIYSQLNNMYITELNNKISDLTGLKTSVGAYKQGIQPYIVEFGYNKVRYKVIYQIDLKVIDMKIEKGFFTKRIVEAHNIVYELEYALYEGKTPKANVIQGNLQIEKFPKPKLIELIRNKVLKNLSEKLAKETQSFVFKL